MKKFFAIISICVTFFACKPGIPSNVIQPDKMEKILFDIHTVNGYIGVQSRPDTAKIVASSYIKGVYTKFEIDSASYTRSLNYYYNRPDLLNKIYENLNKQFEQAKKKNDKEVEAEAVALANKELAKGIKVLVVPTVSTGLPPFSFATNPFVLTPLTPY